MYNHELQVHATERLRDLARMRKMPEEYRDLLIVLPARPHLYQHLIGKLGHLLVRWGSRMERDYQSLLTTADSISKQPTSAKPC